MNQLQRSMATEEDEAFLRTLKNYTEDLMLHDPSRTGIKDETVFHRIPGFCALDNYSIDIMHVILEGICVSDLVELLKLYTSLKYFSVDDLNRRMSNHIWKHNKPPLIDQKDLNNGKIRMSAAETLEFTKNFGILVGDLVPENDSAWRVYINLRQILDIVLAPTIQKDCSHLLKTLAQENHVLAREVLKRNLKPKDHLALHLPRVMDESGPLIHIWSMRCEAKHQESKMAANSSNSKLNVCETIAIKHQLKLARILYEKKVFVECVKGPFTPLHF
uniref:Uncharacterized protein n=1 Tax=Trichogramma kaykai TaxID=54128 RepID=A0ABD2WUQ6_9HYME